MVIEDKSKYISKKNKRKFIYVFLFNILINPFLSIGVLFSILIVLYSLKFSRLYHPDLFYIIFLFSFVLEIFLLNKIFTINTNLKIKVEILLKKLYFKKIHLLICILFFLIGTFANIYEYKVVGWPIFLENKVTRGENIHYVHYITNFLMYSLMLSYIGFRLKKNFTKYLLIIVFTLSLIELLVWLNRGPLFLLLNGIIIFEYLMAYKYKREKKFLIYSLLVLTIFTVSFGYIGNLRVNYVMEHIYKTTVNQFYGMDDYIPSSLVWVYIYTTSPFENFRYMLYYEEIDHYRYGLLLIYPFVAPIFKKIFIHKTETYPYLDSIAGLNVSSFLEDAFNDFYIFGPYIYILYMAIMFAISLRLFYRGVFGFLGYIFIYNMGAWMFFVNGFAIGPLMIGFLFFFLLSIIFEGKTYVKYKC